MTAARAVLGYGHGDAAAVQVAAEQVSQLGFGVGGGVQLGDQGGVQLEPVDVLLGQARGVQVQGYIADALHRSWHIDAADTAVVIGGVGYLVGLDLLGQRFHGHGLQPGYVLGGVILGGIGIGGLYQRGDLFVGHGGLDVGQLLFEGGILFLLRAGFGVGGDQRGGLAADQPFRGCLGVFPLVVPVVHAEQAVLVVLVIPGVACGGVPADHRGNDGIHGVAVLPGQPGGYGQGGGDGIHQFLAGDLGDLLVHDGFEGLGVAGIDIIGHEQYGILGAIHLDVGGEAAVRDGLMQVLLQIRGVCYEQVGHRVQHQLVRQDLLQAGAYEGVQDRGGMLGARAGLHREGQRLHYRSGDGGVARVFTNKIPFLVGREIAVQQLQESPVIVELAVEVGGAVGGMVVFVVVLLQRLPRHVRDVFRVAAGDVAGH